MDHRNFIVIAVTGGMGCGQTSVCQFLEKMGARCINADLVAKREIENNEPVKKELIRSFGKKIFYRDGKLNRKLLARIAFADESKTQRLNRIVHPQMVSRIVTMIEEIREMGKYRIIAVDAALIFELNLEHIFDKLVVVTSDMKNRIQRIQARDQLSQQEITDRINRQIPIEEKVQWADYVIENNGDLEILEKNTQVVYRELQKLFRKKRSPSRVKR